MFVVFVLYKHAHILAVSRLQKSGASCSWVNVYVCSFSSLSNKNVKKNYLVPRGIFHAVFFCWFLCLPSFPYTTFLFGVFISPQSHRMKLSKAAFLLEICISLICITVKRVLWHFSRKRPYEILTF